MQYLIGRSKHSSPWLTRWWLVFNFLSNCPHSCPTPLSLHRITVAVTGCLINAPSPQGCVRACGSQRRYLEVTGSCKWFVFLETCGLSLTPGSLMHAQRARTYRQQHRREARMTLCDFKRRSETRCSVLLWFPAFILDGRRDRRGGVCGEADGQERRRIALSARWNYRQCLSQQHPSGKRLSAQPASETQRK